MKSDKSKHNVGVYQSAPVTSHGNGLELHLGTNTLMIIFIFIICFYVADQRDVLEPSYLMGLDYSLLFFIGFISTILGVSCFAFWNLGKRSLYSFHLILTRRLPVDINSLFTFRDYSVALAARSKFHQREFSPWLRKLGCVAIIFLICLITIDNRGFTKVESIPDTLLSADSDFCPESLSDSLANFAPAPGCELIMRAYELGYTKDLGSCAPKEIDVKSLEICEKRRVDEPYLHYATRLITQAFSSIASTFSSQSINKVEQKIELQWQQIEALRDYQLYAMSAAPRASHHIWTNLPAPNGQFRQAFLDIFHPNYCLAKFQNQKNTVQLHPDDNRSRGKLLEHVYGQLLFNPKVKRTVGLCKEYTIHWESDLNTCDALAENTEEILQTHGALSEVKQVLKRHDIAQKVLSLDDAILALETNIDDGSTATFPAREKIEDKKKPIDKSKIAKNKRFRQKSEVVSFHCFMQIDSDKVSEASKNVLLDNTEFPARTYYFPAAENVGSSQLDTYKNFAKTLTKEFHYSKYSSRSGLEVTNQSVSDNGAAQSAFLQETHYLLARLELLNDVDIFLGNNWVLEREDLLQVYPFHLHLQNYVESFRIEYQQKRGRL